MEEKLLSLITPFFPHLFAYRQLLRCTYLTTMFCFFIFLSASDRVRIIFLADSSDLLPIAIFMPHDFSV